LGEVVVRRVPVSWVMMAQSVWRCRDTAGLDEGVRVVIGELGECTVFDEEGIAEAAVYEQTT